eukprot:349908_1
MVILSVKYIFMLCDKVVVHGQLLVLMSKKDNGATLLKEIAGGDVVNKIAGDNAANIRQMVSEELRSWYADNFLAKVFDGDEYSDYYDDGYVQLENEYDMASLGNINGNGRYVNYPHEHRLSPYNNAVLMNDYNTEMTMFSVYIMLIIGFIGLIGCGLCVIYTFIVAFIAKKK